MSKNHLLCIPRIEVSVTKEYILGVFIKLKIGYIENIQEIPLYKNKEFKRIIIKINWSETSPTAKNILTRLDNNETIKLVHDMPWFWKIVSTTHQR